MPAIATEEPNEPDADRGDEDDFDVDDGEDEDDDDDDLDARTWGATMRGTGSTASGNEVTR